jgi:hypothetical protein
VLPENVFMPNGLRSAWFGEPVVRIAAIVGFALTLIGAGFAFIYFSLVEGSYEAAVRSEPWEWAIVASSLGALAAATAIYGIATYSLATIRTGASLQAVAVLVVLTVVARSHSDLRGSELERTFITLGALTLLFDSAVLLWSWVLPRADHDQR